MSTGRWYIVGDWGDQFSRELLRKCISDSPCDVFALTHVNASDYLQETPCLYYKVSPVEILTLIHTKIQDCPKEISHLAWNLLSKVYRYFKPVFLAEILTIHMLAHVYVKEYTYPRNDMHIYHIDVTHTYTKYTQTPVNRKSNSLIWCHWLAIMAPWLTPCWGVKQQLRSYQAQYVGTTGALFNCFLIMMHISHPINPKWNSERIHQIKCFGDLKDLCYLG